MIWQTILICCFVILIIAMIVLHIEYSITFNNVIKLIKKILLIFINLFEQLIYGIHLLLRLLLRLGLIIIPILLVILIVQSIPDKIVNIKCDLPNGDLPNEKVLEVVSNMIINISQKTVNNNPWLFAGHPVSENFNNDKSPVYVLDDNYIMFKQNNYIWLLDRSTLQIFIILTDTIRPLTKDEKFHLAGNCKIIKKQF